MSSISASVVIPTFNRLASIGTALESVQSQTVPPLEIIVVDDGSDDGTADRVLDYARRDRRIQLLSHDRRKGAQAARNTGIRAARGDWIAFLDSDDRWLPRSLELRVERARATGANVVHSECLVIRDDGAPREFGVQPLEGNVYRQLLIQPGPVYPALLVDRMTLRGIGRLDERILSHHEWDTCLRLAKRWPFAFVKEPTFIYDCRGTDTLSRNDRFSAIGYEQVFRKHTGAILAHAGPRALSQHYLNSATLLRRVGRIDAARSRRLLATILWPLRRRSIQRCFTGLLSE